jgi:hypothetical protein
MEHHANDPRERTRRQAPELRVAHTLPVRLTNLSQISTSTIEARVRVGDVVATPHHEGMDMVSESILIIYCIKN